MEVNRLVRGESVWGELLDLTQSTARVDVMAGASAGGINGALLGVALAHDQRLERLRKVWLDDGSLEALFRSPFQSDPPSLLKGDDYFLQRLRKVFREMVTPTPTSTAQFPVTLIMTTTMLRGERLDFDDDFGTTVHDVIHRGQFVFRREGARDDFATQADAERLALASRSTASFPAAFEASFVPVDGSTDEPFRPDMRGIANFSSSRFVMDGGVLVNKPISPVLRTIFSMPAEQQVRRVLAYVVPDPGVPPRAEPQNPDRPPSMAKVLASGVTLPRVESIGLDLDELREHNRRVRGQRRLRDVLLWEGAEGRADLLRLAEQVFLAYRDSRLESTVGYILDQLTVGTRGLDARGQVGPHGWTREDLRREIRRAVRARIRRAFPAADALAGWPWDVRIAQAVLSVVVNLLQQGMAVSVPASEESWAVLRAELRELRGASGAILEALADIRLRDIDYWKGQAAAFGAVAGDDVRAEATRAVDGWFRGPLRRLPEVPQAAAELLVRAGPTLWAVARRCRSYDPSASSRLKTQLTGLAVPDTPDGGQAALGCQHRLLALAVIQQALAAGQPVLDQPVQLVQISADAPNGFDGRSRADDKLAGIQLGHFGAFYKRSWRANDWMWGRLDGAQRLAQVALSPARIRKLGLASGKAGKERVAHALAAVEEVALGTDPQTKAFLGRWWDRAAAERELAFLESDEPDEVPSRLDVCAAAIARRIQLEVLSDELPHVAESVLIDRDAKAVEAPATLAFARAVLEAQHAAATAGGKAMDPETAVRLFSECEVGRERIGSEAGSDLFTGTATTAAAVGVSAAQGRSSGLGPLRGALSSLRGLVLATFVLARSAVGKSRTAFALLLTLLAAGGAIVAFAIIAEGTSGILVWVGIGLVLAGLALATMRAGPWWVFGLVAVTVLLALSPWIVLETADPSGGTRAWLRDAAPVIAVAVAVLGSMALGLMRAGFFRWLPRDSRVAAGVVGVLALGAFLGVALALEWHVAAVAVVVLLLGLAAGWSLRYASPAGIGRWARGTARAWTGWWRSPGGVRASALLSVVATVLAAVAFLAAAVTLLIGVVAPWAAAVIMAVVGLVAGVAVRMARSRRERWLAVDPGSGDPTTIFELTWSPTGAPDGAVFDVAVRGPGSDDFRTWWADVRAGNGRFRLADLPGAAPGTYEFRARRRRLLTDRHWGWSRPVRVRISEAAAGGAAAPAEGPAPPTEESPPGSPPGTAPPPDVPGSPSSPPSPDADPPG